MPDEATAQQTDDGSNDAGYQQYLRDYEQTKSKLAEKGKRAGTSMSFNEWLIKSEDAAPEQISDEQSSSGAKPVKIKSATGAGVRELGNSGVELRINVEEPSAPPPPIRFPGERRIAIGQHDPNYKKYLNNKANRDQEALENGEDLEPPMDYEDFLDEQQTASEDEGYQKYLADHAAKQEQAKKEGKPDIGEPKSYGEHLKDQATLEDPEYQKHVADKEAAKEQAAAQGIDLGEDGEPLSPEQWRDEQAAKKDDDYQNYKKNLKPEEKAKPYRDWKKEKEEAKKPAEKPPVEEQPKGAETPTETKPPETEQPPKPPEEAPKPTPEPPKTEEKVETPEEEAERERAATTEPPTAEEPGPGGIPPAGGPTPPEAPGEEKQKEREGTQKPATPPTTEGKEGEAAAQMNSQRQQINQYMRQAVTQGIAAGARAATAIPAIGPILKGIAWVVKLLRASGLGEPVAHMIIAWIILAVTIGGLLSLIIPIIGSVVGYLISLGLMPLVLILYLFDVPIPGLGQIAAKLQGPGQPPPTIKSFLKLITDGVAQSAGPVTPPGTPKVGGAENKP